MTEDHVDSYYIRSIAEDRRRPPLDGALETEVCIIGGGMAGLATALGLAERGRKMVLLEARRLGWGASGPEPRSCQIAKGGEIIHIQGIRQVIRS